MLDLHAGRRRLPRFQPTVIRIRTQRATVGAKDERPAESSPQCRRLHFLKKERDVHLPRGQ
jgi:hypothetical protein